jgi:hypothetical protein
MCKVLQTDMRGECRFLLNEWMCLYDYRDEHVCIVCDCMSVLMRLCG